MIRKAKEGKKSRITEVVPRGFSESTKSGFIPLSQCIKDAARKGSTLGYCLSTRALRDVNPASEVPL